MPRLPAACLPAALAATACVQASTVAVELEQTVLIGVPVAFSDSVFVTLGRYAPNVDPVPVVGATLRLVVDSVELSLREGPAGACGLPIGSACYRANVSGLLHPGDSLRLAGELPSGESVFGEARIPPTTRVRVEGVETDTVRGLVAGGMGARLAGIHEAGAAVSVAQTTTWATFFAGSRRVVCEISLPGPPPTADLREARHVVLSLGDPRCPDVPDLAWDSVAAPVTVLTYDEHFTRWIEGNGRISADDDTGVFGAFGVFGAATPTTFVLMVRAAPTAP